MFSWQMAARSKTAQRRSIKISTNSDSIVLGRTLTHPHLHPTYGAKLENSKKSQDVVEGVSDTLLFRVAVSNYYFKTAAILIAHHNRASPPYRRALPCAIQEMIPRHSNADYTISRKKVLLRSATPDRTSFDAMNKLHPSIGRSEKAPIS